jgi:hypothetical protein
MYTHGSGWQIFGNHFYLVTSFRAHMFIELSRRKKTHIVICGTLHSSNSKKKKLSVQNRLKDSAHGIVKTPVRANKKGQIDVLTEITHRSG